MNRSTAGQVSLSRLQVLSVALGCAVLMAGCGGGTSSNAAGTLPTSPSSSTTSHQSGSPRSHVWRCRLVSQKALEGKTFDTSEPLPCTTRHNVETASFRAVYGTSGLPSKAIVDSYDGDCGRDAASFLHLQQLMVQRVVSLPVPTKSGAGKTVIACDLVVAARAGDNGLPLPTAVTRTSLKVQAASGDRASWHLCANRLTSPSFPLTDCTKPHPVEALFHGISLTLTSGHYPRGGTDHNARGDAVCRRAVASRPDGSGLTVHSHWESRTTWVREGEPSALHGVCWFWRTDGRDLPADQ